MKKLILLLTTVAFMTGSLGFIGCGGIEEDPAAVSAKEPDNTSDTDDPDKDANEGEGEGEKKFKTKKDPDDPDDDNDEGE
jgi:hypothetical protein